MNISPEMSIEDLIGWMGERVRPEGARFASQQEAADLRELLVTRYPEGNIADIPDGEWHALCCAVDPAERYSTRPR